jgi:hypothetical protein
LTEFLDTVKLMIAEKEEEARQDETKRNKDLLYKLRHMRDVLERWKIVGLNRKLQVRFDLDFSSTWIYSVSSFNFFISFLFLSS